MCSSSVLCGGSLGSVAKHVKYQIAKIKFL